MTKEKVDSKEINAASIYMTMLTFGLLQGLDPYFSGGKISMNDIDKAWERTSHLEEVSNEKGYWQSQLEKGDHFAKTQWELWKSNFVNLS